MGPDLGRELRQEGGTKGENAQKNEAQKNEAQNKRRNIVKLGGNLRRWIRL